MQIEKFIMYFFVCNKQLTNDVTKTVCGYNEKGSIWGSPFYVHLHT